MLVFESFTCNLIEYYYDNNNWLRGQILRNILWRCCTISSFHRRIKKHVQKQWLDLELFWILAKITSHQYILFSCCCWDYAILVLCFLLLGEIWTIKLMMLLLFFFKNKIADCIQDLITKKDVSVVYPLFSVLKLLFLFCISSFAFHPNLFRMIHRIQISKR